MPELITRLATTVDSRLKKIGCERPPLTVLKALLETAYHASLRTEEGRFMRGSITFAHPRPRPEEGPARRRSDYPGFWPLGRRIVLTVENLAKLSRAIDMWSGSIGVFGTKVADIHIWGVVDQLVQSNIRLNHETTDRGFNHPGILYITMDGVGALTIYHDGVRLGGLRGHQLLIREEDALGAGMVGKRIMQHLHRPAEAIRNVVGSQESQEENLMDAWIATVYRLSIGVRRYGTGGTMLITSTPQLDQLEIAYKFDYPRLGDAMMLNVLDEEHKVACWHRVREEASAGVVPYSPVLDLSSAEADAEDRQSELMAAVKIVSSLASIDGLLLLTPLLHVKGFGVKIKTGGRLGTVYDGGEFEKRGTNAKKVDTSRFGTRHNSVLRYCRLDKNAIGVVVSQDGNVRIAMSAGRSLVLWDNVKLLGYEPYSLQAVRGIQKWIKRRDKARRPQLGYSDTPKTIDALLSILNG